MLTGFHGATAPAIHVGFCITDRFESAELYATDKNAGSTVAEVKVDTAGLTVVEVADFADNGNGDWVAYGDDTADVAEADIVTFLDVGLHFETHRTWRLMTSAAVAAAEIVGTYQVGEDDE